MLKNNNYKNNKMKTITTFKRLFISAILLPTFGFAQSSGTATTSVKTTAVLSSTCQMTVNNINFGQFHPGAMSGYDTATNQINILCSKGASYSVGLSYHTDGSLSSAGNWNGYGTLWTYSSSYAWSDAPTYMRVLTGGSSGNTDILVYKIYSDSGYTQEIGDASVSGTHLISGTGTGINQMIPLYSRMNLDQWVTPDTYSSTVVATVNF
jgi:spore coat protein U-like protein